jgi:hypothetical protein
MSKTGKSHTIQTLIARRIERFVANTERVRDAQGYIETSSFVYGPGARVIRMNASEIRGRKVHVI